MNAPLQKEHKGVYKFITPFLFLISGNILLAFFLKRPDFYNNIIVYAVLFFSYVFICKQNLTTNQILFFIIGSLFLRLLWLPAFPQLSDDYARFVWDGRLLAHGYNPYFYLPSEIMKTGYPTTSVDLSLYHALNSQQYYTPYPPLLQLIFAISSVIFPKNLMGNIITLRLFIFFAEIGSIVLITKLLPLFNLPKKNVLLYALNPLVITELAGNFHFESLVIFFLLFTLLCIYQKKFGLSIVMLTLSILSKLVPLIFLPLLVLYFGVKKGILYCLRVLGLFIIGWLPFIDADVIRNFWSSINSYFIESEFNASIYYGVRFVVAYFKHENMIEIIGPLLSVTSAVLIFVYAFCKKNKIGFDKLPGYFIFTILIFLSFTTTVHPWYITPMIGLCTLTNYRFPVMWSACIFLSYYTYHTQIFEESTGLLIIEYGLILVALFRDLYLNKKSFQFSIAKS